MIFQIRFKHILEWLLCEGTLRLIFQVKTLRKPLNQIRLPISTTTYINVRTDHNTLQSVFSDVNNKVLNFLVFDGSC